MGSSLERDGFVILPGVLDAGALTTLRDLFERVVGPASSGTRHADKLESRDPLFASVISNSRVLEAVQNVLGRPFHLFLLSARDPLPGFGLQGLHTDWVMRMPGDPYAIVTTLWLLDDFNEKNGATRVVPGSHRSPQALPKSMQQPAAHHKEEKGLTAKAGSVIVFNGHLWHSGTRNDTTLPRRVLQCQFVADDAVRRAGPAAPASGVMATE